jgi:hypothetical protein
MDFTKFVAMLEHSSLYFSRADLLGDPFEGSHSRANEQMRPARYPSIPEDVLKTMGKHLGAIAKDTRLGIFVNCWHMNNAESAGMWRLYAKTNEAVAVRSSFEKLHRLMDEDVYLGVVQYIDFERDWLAEGNAFYPYVHKRLSFSHEAELRAVMQRIPQSNGIPDPTAPQPLLGIQKHVALDDLIDSVYVAPTCPPWFRDLVQSVCERYELKKPVHKSSLDAEPFF